MSDIIRVTRGVGSNPKLWAILQRGRQKDQVGEFDLSDRPGVETKAGISGMSGIIWRDNGHPADVTPRKLYRSMQEWIIDIEDEYPGAKIILAITEGPNWP